MIKYNENESLNNLIKYFNYNYGGLFILILCSTLISFYTDKEYFKGLFSLWLSSLVIWYGHYRLHKYPDLPLSKFHSWTHHSPFAKTYTGKFLELGLVEIFGFGGGLLWLLVLLVHKYTNKYYLNPYVIIWYTLAVSLVHEFYYHSQNTKTIHTLHHENEMVNFQPDIWDIVLKTKDNNADMEDETSVALFMFVWCIIFLLIIKNVQIKL
jgi:hypothetical protein